MSTVNSLPRGALGLCPISTLSNPSMILTTHKLLTLLPPPLPLKELVLTGVRVTRMTLEGQVCGQYRSGLSWGGLKPKNPELWSYFSPKLVMRCILVCTAETQRALHVHSIPESPPQWVNTASHSLSVTLQHMILTPTALLISLFMNVVAYKKDISSRGCDCAQRR